MYSQWGHKESDMTEKLSLQSKTPYFTKILELLSKLAVYQWLEFIARLAGGSCYPTIYFTNTGLLKKTLRLKDDK